MRIFSSANIKMVLVGFFVLFVFVFVLLIRPFSYHYADNYSPMDKDVVHLNGLYRSLEIHKSLTGRYPTTKQGLESLVGQNILVDSVSFSDKWLRPITYRYPSICGVKPFDLYSNGLNGNDECGKGDDLVGSNRQ